jgi:hypothetical protein
MLQKRSHNLEVLYLKVYTACLKATKRFKQIHQQTVKDYNFEQGDLVLMQNIQIEKALNLKMQAWYLGPLVVITQNFSGAYVLCKLDGSVLHHLIAAFQLLSYVRKSIILPLNFTDINKQRLEEL